MYPTLPEAQKLLEDMKPVLRNLNIAKNKAPEVSLQHYQNVAACAQKIAATCGLNEEKAYILGLFHDYGEITESTVPHTFHGTAGYDEMMRMGYDEVAKVCLTHSFWEDIYDPAYFSYEAKEIRRAAELISTMKIDDYDRLIQACDMMSQGKKIVTFEQRIDGLIGKYNIPQQYRARKLEAAHRLKKFFDDKCGQDIYVLLEIV